MIEAKIRDAVYLCLANWMESDERTFRQDIGSWTSSRRFPAG